MAFTRPHCGKVLPSLNMRFQTDFCGQAFMHHWGQGKSFVYTAKYENSLRSLSQFIMRK